MVFKLLIPCNQQTLLHQYFNGANKIGNSVKSITIES